MKERVVIAGGGLAGLTCAKQLAEAGYAVELYEGLPYLGGRASTYRDADGDWIEQGLHLFLGTYSRFKQVLREIGQDPDAILFWMSQVRYQDLDGTEAVYGTNPLAAPLKTVLSFLGQNRYLGPLDKASLVPISLFGLRSMKALERDFDGMTVTQWWKRMHGTEDVMEKFLRPFCRAIQFTDADDFSAYNFLGWLHHVAYDLVHSYCGGYRGARDEIIFQPFARYLRSKGVTIRTGTKLKRILFDGRKRLVKGFVLEGGERVEADRYVAAIPAWAFAPLIPGVLRDDPFFSAIPKLPIAPAIAVQLWLDRNVVKHADFILMARSVVPVYQNQSQPTYGYDRGDRLSTTISPADAYLGWSDEQLVRLTWETLSKADPALRRAQVVKSVVLKHQSHLVRPLPGAMAARPRQATPVANLFLAGDWTQQDYFGSQEGAVRGGLACAEAILEASAAESARPTGS